MIDENKVVLSGIIKEDIKFIAEFYGTKIYETKLGVLRLSGCEDIIPIHISDKLSNFDKVKSGVYISIVGSMHSTQKRDENKVKRTMVYTQVDSILDINKLLPDDCSYTNEVSLSGKVLKPVILRKSKSNENIDLAEVMLKVSKGYGKFYHIPLVVWGSNAKKVAKLDVDDELSITGRFQSRKFIRHARDSDTEFESGISYEVSVKTLTIGEEDVNVSH